MLDRLVLSDVEAQQLYDYTKNAYLDPNKWGPLSRLLDRIDTHLGISQKRLQEASR